MARALQIQPNDVGRNHALLGVWALLAALLIFAGLGVPGPAPERPPAEYGEAARPAADAVSAPTAPGPATIAASILTGRPGSDAPAKAAIYPAESIARVQGAVRHAYEAVGPPLTHLSQRT